MRTPILVAAMLIRDAIAGEAYPPSYYSVPLRIAIVFVFFACSHADVRDFMLKHYPKGGRP